MSTTERLSDERLAEIASAANHLTAHSPHPRITVAEAAALVTELQHSRAAEVPEGWKLIPRRPTEDMMQAGNYQSSHDSTSADVYSAWVDMWDVAPSPDEYENPSKLERKAAASPSPATGVRVKPLEWTNLSYDPTWHIARGAGVEYSVFRHRSGKQRSQVRTIGGVSGNIGDFDTVEEAKARAQADFERRIRFALVEQP